MVARKEKERERGERRERERERERRRHWKQDASFKGMALVTYFLQLSPSFYLSIMPSNYESINGLIH
jgi:hypothetical protein